MKQVHFSSFDSAANTYDSDFTFTEIGKLQRTLVYQFLAEKILPIHTLSILEINCGTGVDALWLANKGNEVVATDASAKMIEQAKHKISVAKNAKLSFEQASFSELKSKYNNQKFDLIFSNFGGLNCVNDVELKKALLDFSTLLKPNGKLVLVIMGKKCLWERVYFLLKKNSKQAYRRLSEQPVDAHLGDGVTQSTFYHSPSEVRSYATDNFVHKATQSVGIAIPPSYLEPFFKSKKWLLKILTALEMLIGRISFLADYADHYLIYFERKSEE